MTSQQMIDYTTNTTAAGAVASPVWLPYLREVSEFASLAAPVLGATWLIVQIVIKVREHLRNSREQS